MTTANFKPQHFLWELDDRAVATVTLNRPEVHNAYNGDLIQGLLATMDKLGARAQTSALLFAPPGRKTT